MFLALSAIGLKPLLGLISKGAGKNRRKHHELTRQKLQSRIEKGSPVPDIIGRLIDKRAEFVSTVVRSLDANCVADVAVEFQL